MPVLTAPACVPSEACPATPFPVATANCNPLLSVGGVNDLYFIPCDQELSEVNILDTAWWQALVTGSSPATSFLGNIGIGLGSIGKKATKSERVSSCKTEQLVSATWALKYIIKAFDKSSEKITHEQVSTLLTNSGRYLAIARMCDGENTVLPIGSFAVSDFDWTVPDNFEEIQSITLEISWFELAMPKTYDVTGLSAIVPKAA
jgi:hypothetical protein